MMQYIYNYLFKLNNNTDEDIYDVQEKKYTVNVNENECVLCFKNIDVRQISRKFDSIEKCMNNKIYHPEHDNIIMTSNRDNNIYLPTLNHGLLSSIFLAYNYHIPLVLRPDDIWLSIAMSFGNYVKNHSDELRDIFVDHTGKSKLVVQMEKNIMNNLENCELFINEMCEKIKNNTRTDIVEWIVPNFTTTTHKDKIISNIALMGSVSNYFEYTCEMLCGLSKVILKGTHDDWKLLLQKVETLYKFNIPDITNWTNLLLHVLKEFAGIYENKVDDKFWQRICTSSVRGSGGQKNFRGWFIVFSPFNSMGKYMLKTFDEIKKDNIYGNVNDSDIVECSINVPVLFDNNGKIFQLSLYGGILMVQYDVNKQEICPKADWLLINKKEIILDDMLKKLNHNINIKLGTKLIKYAYYMAKICHFSNDTLLELADSCIYYLKYYWKNKEEDDLYKKYTEYLLNDYQFGKLMDESKVNNIIKNYND